jgi:hypothetical protein
MPATTTLTKRVCRLLNTVIDHYVDAFDEEPLPVAVADHAYQRLLELVSDIDFGASAEQRLATINPCGGPRFAALKHEWRALQRFGVRLWTLAD